MSVCWVWGIAAVIYAAFYCWYVGFRRKLSADEVEICCQQLETHYGSPDRVEPIRAFLSKDSGRDFFIANYVKLHARTAAGEKGSVVMNRYQKPFLKSILRRGCHPIAVGIAASRAVELWGVNNAEDWTVAAFVRYRSRRDLAEILLTPAFQQLHPFKEAALEKTIAFICDPAYIIGGGPKVTVPLVLVALSAVFTIFLQ